MNHKGKGRIFQPKGRRVLMLAYYGPRPDGRWGEVRESARTRDLEKAQSLLDRRLRQVENHREGLQQFQGPAQQRLTVGNLLDGLEQDYRDREIKGLRVALAQIKPVRALFGHEQAVSVTSDLVRKYVEKRRELHRANATINRELEKLGRAYNLAVEEKRISAQFVPKIPSLPENNTRRGFFEKGELEALLPHLPDPIDDMVRFAAMCGWRLGEIFQLRWDAVDAKAHEIRLYDSKNGRGRVLPLDDEDWKLIEKRLQARAYVGRSGPGASGHVFHRNGKPVDQTTFRRQWRAACLKAGLGRIVDVGGKAQYQGKIFHDLRRTAARDMIRGGAPESFAMKITGHRTRSMFDRYNVVSSDDMRETLRRRRVYVDGLADGANVATFRSTNKE